MPSNTSVATAIPLSIPSSTTIDLFDAISTGLWYSYTAVDGDSYLGIQVTPNPPGVYDPFVYTYINTTPTAGLPAHASAARRIQFQVAVGHTYYFKFMASTGTPPIGTMATMVIVAPLSLSPAVGSIIVPDETKPTSQGQHAIMVRISDGAVIKAFPFGGSPQNGDVLPSGVICTEQLEVSGYISAALYGGDLTLIGSSTTAGLAPNSSTTLISSDQVDSFYILPQSSIAFPWVLHKLVSDGTLSGTTWALPSANSIAHAIASGVGGHILYWTRSGGPTAIERYDLDGHAALSNLAAAVAGHWTQYIYVLADASIIVYYSTQGGNPATDDLIRQYAPDGSILRDYYSVNYDAPSGFHQLARHPGGAGSFMVWTHTSDSSGVVSRFIRISTVDGSVVAETTTDSFSADVGRLGTTQSFGPTTSCPFYLVAQAGCVAPAITTQPTNHTIDSGQVVTLTVVATGTATLTYQWYLGLSGDTSSPIGGATSAAYVTPALTTPVSYWVRVSNGCGAADSDTAVMSPAGWRLHRFDMKPRMEETA